MNKNVLIICPFFSPNIGGVETHLNDLVEGLVRKNIKVDVLTYQPLTTRVKSKSRQKSKYLTIRRIQWFGHNWFFKLEAYPFIQFLYLFPGLFVHSLIFLSRNRQRIDLIHAHGLIAATIARCITLLFPKKKVFSVHAVYGFTKRKSLSWLVTWILKDFSCLIALAQASAKDLIAAGLPAKKITVVHQWVNQELFKPRLKTGCRQELNLPKEFTVLFVGRLLKKKGVRLLIKVAQASKEISFVLVGDGPEKNFLESKVKELALKNVLLVGKRSQAKTAIYYGAADVVVIPSLYEEGFSRVVLESLSSGRPVIASNKGCLPEMIPSGVGSCVAPTAENIKREIDIYYRKRHKLTKVNRKCRACAQKQFSQNNISKIISIYGFN